MPKVIEINQKNSLLNKPQESINIKHFEDPSRTHFPKWFLISHLNQIVQKNIKCMSTTLEYQTESINFPLDI